ncbi:MAG: alpha/beta hydrolase [Chloroflexi bacterium]|nr:alpha/beta hydrolase [Chloroflexota bacterium]
MPTPTTGAIEPTTHTLDVPGATLTYDVRRYPASTEPPLFLIGSPMGAGGFPTLASHFTDRTVITYDVRGSERSIAHDPAQPITPEVRADDVHRIIEAVGGPVDLFASSGGAVVALALVAKHPHDVRTAVAHEPPLASLVPDREHALALNQAMNATYRAKGWGAGMAHFMQVVMHEGPLTAEDVAKAPPDPAMFGLPTDDDGGRNDLMLAHNVLWLTSYEPDFEAIRRGPTRVVIGVGATSNGHLAQRGGEAAAERLGIRPTIFPGGHDGFMGGEYGGIGQPTEFAATLREVLSSGS